MKPSAAAPALPFLPPAPDTALPLLGGLTPQQFMRRHWQKKPLLVRQAIPGFESPISPDELAGLALELARALETTVEALFFLKD